MGTPLRALSKTVTCRCLNLTPLPTRRHLSNFAYERCSSGILTDLGKYDRAAGEQAMEIRCNKLSSMISVLYMGASLIVKYLSLAPRDHMDFVAALWQCIDLLRKPNLLSRVLPREVMD